ncbi:MAG: hypothetical protein Tsb0018_06230 [Opitutales bacterium]
MSALDVYIDSQVSEFEEEIQDLVRYCVASQGKRIRATLTFLSAWGGSQEPSEAVVKAAAVIELVHLATLVHDDILDEATLRRNRLTADKKYGSKIAVLLGDALFSQALKLASEFPTTDVCRAVSRATRQVCTGEIEQIFQRGNADVSLEGYYRVIRLKTAELFEVACALGAGLGGYSVEYAQAAARFGQHLGIAYQIFDDWADLVADEEAIGKTLGTDLATGKFTLPLLLLVQKMRQEGCSDQVKRLIANKLSPSELMALFAEYAIEELVRGRFMGELKQGEACLSSLPDDSSKCMLMNILCFFEPLMEAHTLSKALSV